MEGKKKAVKKTAAKRGAPRTRGAKRTIQFLHKPTCTTCRKARAFLENRGVALNFRNLDKERLNPAELEKLIGSRDHTEFLNPRNDLYRQNNMKQNPPERDEAIRLMAENPNLIRRPVVLAGGRVVLGFDPDEFRSI
ncbi:MAG TPA: Spx/MgsR family RNA polymerase-binding regulatory protein [Candidatus Acidoferrales bacterium]|nr:Spx/MgsR family RNA polymerase-binding regulatory protein [Candidatus Acidoferrales bacterium]